MNDFLEKDLNTFIEITPGNSYAPTTENNRPVQVKDFVNLAPKQNLLEINANRIY